MVGACWITNSGNLESPPDKSLLSFPSASWLSNTIMYSPLLLLLIYPLWSFPLVFLPPLFCHSFPLIHYPSTKYLLWQGYTVADFFLFTSTPNTQQCSTHSTLNARLTRAHEHTPSMHQQPSNVLARDSALKTNTDPGVRVCVFPLISQRFGGAGLRCGWEPQRYVIQSLRVYVFNLVAAVGQSVT